jgi:hypothetical protein
MNVIQHLNELAQEHNLAFEADHLQSKLVALEAFTLAAYGAGGRDENARIIALLDSYRDQLRAQTRALLDEGFNTDNSRAQLEMLTLLREALKA